MPSCPTLEKNKPRPTSPSLCCGCLFTPPAPKASSSRPTSCKSADNPLRRRTRLSSSLTSSTAASLPVASVSASPNGPLRRCALDDKAALPITSRHESPRERRYAFTLALARDDQVEPLPAADVPGHFLGPRTLPLRRRACPHLHRSPRPPR